MTEEEKRKLVDELHKPARRYYQRRQVDIRGLDDNWQADLVDMSAYAKVNQGYRFILTVIDNFSKFAWARPLKTKNGVDVTKAMRSILEQGRQPRLLHVDQGKEFYNDHFKRLMDEYNIRLYSTFSNLHASICERYNRTLKTRMWKEFSFRGTYKWIDMLPLLVLSYNTTKHRTIGMKPADVTVADANPLQRVYRERQPPPRKKPKFKVGDKVRASKFKHVFQKGYTPSFTTEIFTVSAVKPTIPVTYRLKDYQDKPIQGGFYQEELTAAKYPDLYLIEKVLKRRGNRLYVKWLGFDSSHNSWIDA